MVPIDQLLGLVARVEHEGPAVDEVADRDLAIGERLYMCMRMSRDAVANAIPTETSTLEASLRKLQRKAMMNC